MTKMVAPLEVGVCCGDLDRLIQFYIDTLDARLIGSVDVSVEKAREAAVGNTGYRIARIQLPTGERMKFIEPSLPPEIREDQLRPILEVRNTTYLTFIVDDLVAAQGRLNEAGAVILTKAGGVEIRPGVSILLARDPEDNVIEFVSYDDLASYRPELG